MRHHHNAAHFCQLCHKGCSSKALLDQHKTTNHEQGERWGCSEEKNGCGFAPAASKFHLGKFFKGSSDQSHFIFEINVGKRRKMSFVAVELLNYFVISERHYKAVHIPKCRWGGCQVRVPKHKMAAHEAICRKRSNNQNERVATHQLNTEPEPAVKINMSFTLEICSDKIIKDLKAKGELDQQD